MSLCILLMAEFLFFLGGGGDPEHFDILVISWQFEHFWANNIDGALTIHTEL